MTLAEELERAAGAASAHGPVSAVLAADPAGGGRGYLVAYGEDDARRWLVLDEAGRPADERVRVREVASLVAMCELPAELGGAEEAARVPSPESLDAVGTRELGAAAGTVDAFVAEVEERYALPLR
jgi:hypothetical protein